MSRYPMPSATVGKFDSVDVYLVRTLESDYSMRFEFYRNNEHLMDIDFKPSIEYGYNSVLRLLNRLENHEPFDVDEKFSEMNTMFFWFEKDGHLWTVDSISGSTQELHLRFFALSKEEQVEFKANLAKAIRDLFKITELAEDVTEMKECWCTDVDVYVTDEYEQFPGLEVRCSMGRSASTIINGKKYLPCDGDPQLCGEKERNGKCSSFIPSGYCPYGGCGRTDDLLEEEGMTDEELA